MLFVMNMTNSIHLYHLTMRLLIDLVCYDISQFGQQFQGDNGLGGVIHVKPEPAAVNFTTP
jgi:hypothetical protein